MIKKLSDINLPHKIETSRILLRPWKEEDAAKLFTLQRESVDPLNKWYLGSLAQNNASLDDVKRYISESISNWENKSSIEYCAFEKESGALIGATSLHHLDWTVPKGRIGYFVGNRMVGKGYATEMANLMTRYAFDILALERLEIRASNQNPASSKIPRKLGYEYLALFEKNKMSVNGDLWDLEIHVRFNTIDLPHIEANFIS